MPGLSLSFLLLASLLVGSFQEPDDQGGDLSDVEIPQGVVEDEGEYLTLRFDETEDGGLNLLQFIKICQMNTGLNFTIDETSASNTRSALATKKLLLYGTKRIKKADFYSFFQIMMKISGFVCVQQGSGDLAVIVITAVNPTTQSMIKSNALFVESDEVEFFADKPGTYIATVVPLKYAQAQSLGVNLRSAVGSSTAGSAQDSFMPLPQVNALLVQGFGPFVAAAVRMLRLLDVEPEKAKPEFARIRMQEASAEELAQLLTDLLENLEGQGVRQQRARGAEEAIQPEIETRVIANPRDNSLLVVASSENMELVKDLVAQLDTKVEIPETNFRLYVLRNISAADLEEDLQRFLQRTQQAEEQAARSAGQQGGGLQLRTEQRIVVEAQDETNSLLITATRTKWAELKRLLERLDQRQPQVLIETALIEVSEEFTRDIGFEYASVDPPTGDFSRGFGFSSVGISSLLDTDGDLLPDTRVPDSTLNGFTGGILDGADFGLPFLLNAAQTRSDANVLSVPSILVTNNRGATVESVDEVPVTEQTPVQSVGVTESFSGFQEAGIKLSITPSISSKSYLRLGISLEVSTFRGAFEPGSTVPPPKITRRLDTTVYLPDGATMWVGGIIRDDLVQDETGIPWLSDIPIFGWVFGRTTDNNIKTTLFFFCTPRILDDFEELADISEDGKAQAATVIGLDRLRRVDPDYELPSPLDVILDEDVDGDGNVETGFLDLSSFSAPSFQSTGGEVDPATFGAENLPRRPIFGAEPGSTQKSGAAEASGGRNLPEGGRR